MRDPANLRASALRRRGTKDPSLSALLRITEQLDSARTRVATLETEYAALRATL